MRVLLFLITMLLLLSSLTHAEIYHKSEEPNKKIEEGGLDEIAGLILDRTITVIGHDFYRSFTSFWRLNYSENTTNFSIVERPTARFGSEMWIDYRGQKIGRLFLSPSRSQVEETAEAVAQAVNEKITQLKLTEMFRDTFDMERGEL